MCTTQVYYDVKKVTLKVVTFVLASFLISCSPQKTNTDDLTYSVNNYCKRLDNEFKTSQFMLENMLEKDSIPPTAWFVFKNKGTNSLLTLYWGRFAIEVRDTTSNYNIDQLRTRYEKLHEEMRNMHLWYAEDIPNRAQITKLRDKLIELNLLIKEVNKIPITKK
ncbi:hypothetical protein [Aquimarina mytili]|uniref:Uncharacterized protein n=1 Tax=Aquimarina mytili TaxID=874423 RepID=A0A936ZSK4_9FLAO|nr:hypothetical protein [Aquimarina mytili]MBL0683527.1 hypothetical protein [Aquimarina mytili]